MIDTLFIAIFIGAGLLVISILTSLIAYRVGAPLLLIFLAVGLAAGEDGIGLAFDDADGAFFVGSIALAVILFDSGFGTSWSTFRTAAWPAMVLATIGVALTAVLLAVAAYFLLDLPWLEALLIGSIVSSTDAAAVFFLLRIGGITIRERVRATLEVESASNDPMAIFLVTVLVELIVADVRAETLTLSVLYAFVLQMGLGIALGVAGGFAIVQGINRTALEPALYPLVVLGSALVLFAFTGLVGGSGFLAVFVAGLFAGNQKVRAGPQLRRFQDGMTWLAQIVMFLMLGLLATPSEFLDILFPVLGVAFFLMFVARPVAVILCLLPFGFRRGEVAFISWVGLRGAVSILLAILPILGGLEHAQLLFNAAFIIVLVSLLVQGWTIKSTASWLGLVLPPSIGPLERELLELPGSAHHELVVYHIAARSPVARGERLPRWARPSLVIRNGRSMRIHQVGRLQPGDYVYIFTVPAHIQLLDRLFASPHALDDRDFAFYGDLAIQPSARIADLVRTYDIDRTEADEDMTVGNYLHGQLGGRAEVGDRLAVDTVDLIVREIDGQGRITQIGLALAPSRERKRESLLGSLRNLLVDKPRRAAARIRGGKDRKR